MFVFEESVDPIDFEGLTITDYTAASNLSSSCAAIRVEPGVSHRKSYSKRSDKYYLVQSGTISFTLGGDSRTMSKGDFCFVPRGELFYYSNPGSEDAHLILFHTPSFDLDHEVFLDS